MAYFGNKKIYQDIPKIAKSGLTGDGDGVGVEGIGGRRVGGGRHRSRLGVPNIGGIEAWKN